MIPLWPGRPLDPLAILSSSSPPSGWRGKASTFFAVARGLGLGLTENQRKRVATLKNLDQLQQWTERVAAGHDLIQVLGD